MDHQEVIRRVEQIIPDVQKTRDPQGVLLKLASAENWAPAQLQRVAQLFNTAKTLTYYEKTAGSRGDSFPVVDTEELLKEYTDFKIEQKAANVDPWLNNSSGGLQKAASCDPDDIDSWLEKPKAHEKSARFPHLGHALDPLIVELEGDEEFVGERAINEWYSNKEASMHVIRICDEFRDMHEENVRTKMAKLVDDFDLPFAEMEEDALDLNPRLKEAVELIAYHRKFAGAPTTRLSVPTDRVLAEDRHNLVPLLENIQESLDAMKAANSLIDEEREAPSKINSMGPAFTKVIPTSGSHAGAHRANGAKRRNEAPKRTTVDNPEEEKTPNKSRKDNKGSGKTGNPDDAKTDEGDRSKNKNKGDTDEYDRRDRKPKSKSFGEGKDLEPSKYKRESGGADSIASLLKGFEEGVGAGSSVKGLSLEKTPWESLLNVSTSQALRGSAPNKQKTVDKALGDDDFGMMLQRFMISDPIISEADPELVVSLASSIRDINPEFAAAPARMRLALREGIQYDTDGIPLHTVNELTKLRGDSAKALQTVKGNEDAKYSTGDIA